MSPDKVFEGSLIIVPILFLLAVGAIIALRSGVGELDQEQTPTGIVIFPLDALYHLVFNPNTTRVWIASPEENFVLIASPGRWSTLVPALQFHV